MRAREAPTVPIGTRMHLQVHLRVRDTGRLNFFIACVSKVLMFNRTVECAFRGLRELVRLLLDIVAERSHDAKWPGRRAVWVCKYIAGHLG